MFWRINGQPISVKLINKMSKRSSSTAELNEPHTKSSKYETTDADLIKRLDELKQLRVDSFDAIDACEPVWFHDIMTKLGDDFNDFMMPDFMACIEHMVLYSDVESCEDFDQFQNCFHQMIRMIASKVNNNDMLLRFLTESLVSSRRWMKIFIDEHVGPTDTWQAKDLLASALEVSGNVSHENMRFMLTYLQDNIAELTLIDLKFALEKSTECDINPDQVILFLLDIARERNQVKDDAHECINLMIKREENFKESIGLINWMITRT